MIDRGQGPRARGRLDGQVAIVTGAGRGIGRAIALALGNQGATVVVASRTLLDAEETVALLRGKGHAANATHVDVADWSSVEQMVSSAVGEFGGVHILVNNAGVQGPVSPLDENDVDAWARTIQVNLVGAFHCCKAVIPWMRRAGGGAIVNLSGGGATAPRPNFSAYAASKAGVVRLTETLAEEMRPYGIRVNAIAPGAVNTRMYGEILAAGAKAGEKALMDAARQQETGGTPPELAAALVVFLASAASDGLTGKLVAAPYDSWQGWDEDRIADLMSDAWLTLRRMDAFTLGPLARKLIVGDG